MTDQKTVLITGVTGQIGSALATKLVNEGHKVFGLKRWSSDIKNARRVDHIYNHPNFKLIYGDLRDYSSIVEAVKKVQPDWFINMGAMSFVKLSFDEPELTFDVTGTSVIRCLESCRLYAPNVKFLNAASSEILGGSPPPQNEKTPIYPRSPYGVAKAAGYWATINYREAYGMKTYNSITFNTESNERSNLYVVKKITAAAARIKAGLQTTPLYLGNLDAKRDWVAVEDSIRAMQLILESEVPADYCVGSGVSRSVKELVELSFSLVGLNWQDHVKIDPRLFRPSEVHHLQADSSLIKEKLGWEPCVTFEQLVKGMLEHDLELAEKELYMKNFKRTITL